MSPADPLRFTVISCSRDPHSRSRALAKQARQRLEAAGHAVTLLDLRERPLPGFDNDQAYDDANFAAYHQAIRSADGVLLAVPVYNWGVGGAAKNLVELTGSTDAARGLDSAWFDQLVTFLVAGGLPHSYMAHTNFAASLTLDFKCVLNPYHVYATGRDWTGDDLSESVSARLDKTLAVHAELAARLRGRSYRSGWEV